jgi:hypothetical protein
VTIEFVIGLCLLSIFELAYMFGLAMRKPVCIGTMFATPALCLLTDSPKIDQLSHSILNGISVQRRIEAQ